MNLDLVTLTGENHAIISPTNLEGALARPLHGFAGVEVFPTLPQKAGALLDGLAQGHAFEQGNKRTAWNASVTFLGINSLQLQYVPDDEAAEFVLDVVEHRRDAQSAALWFVDHIAF